MDYMDEFFLNMQKKLKEREEKSKDIDSIIEEIKSGYVKSNDLDLEIQEMNFFENKFKVFMPSSFLPMDAKMMKMKYPNESRPTIIYTNKSGTVDIGLNHLKESINQDLIPDLKKIMQDAYISVNPSSKICDSGDFELGKHILSYYTFTNFAIGGQMFNLLFLFPFFEEVLVINMNCLKKDRERYELLFYGMMNTVELLSD